MPIKYPYPITDIMIGDCPGCSGTMFDYEATFCLNCGSQVHAGCIEKCSMCGRSGCRACLEHDPETGLYHCGVEHRVDHLRVEAGAEGGTI